MNGTKTFERPGRSGTIYYVVTFRNGIAIDATSFYNKEDGVGGINECVRRINPNGPTVQKIINAEA